MCTQNCFEKFWLTSPIGRTIKTSATAGLVVTKTEHGYTIQRPDTEELGYTVADINELSLVIDALDWFQNG